MKIMPPNQTPDPTHQKAVGKTPSIGSGPSFDQVLDRAVDGQSSPVSQVPKAIQINRPPIVATNYQPTLQESAELVEKTLEALESYRSALSDVPATSLRQIEPLLSSLEAQRQAMDATMSSLPADNPLRQIGVQASAAILAEQGRFRSGIYN